MPQPIIELSRSGQPLHFAVANGFPPLTYTPLLQPLAARYRVVCLPPRALWPGEQPPPALRDWSMLADDLLSGLRAYDLTGVIAVGHSFGGVASLLAALAEPERFRALILLDPTILPPPAMALMEQFVAQGSIQEFPLVQGALRRRRRFASVEAAFAYFSERSLFRDWPEAALRLYAQHGTRPAADGDGVELSWPPEWEAYYFSTLYTRTWEALPRLRGRLPTLVVRGQTSDTFLPEAAAQVKELLPEAAHVEVPDYGHLFPLAAPEATRRVIADWLETIGL